MEDMDLSQPTPVQPNGIQPEISNVCESGKERPNIFSLLAFEFLKQDGSRLRRLTMEKLCDPSYNAAGSSTGALSLSTEEVMRVARAKFIKYIPQSSDDLPSYPNDYALFNLSDGDIKNVELAQFLLASAEKISNQQYDHAVALLNECYSLSSITGSPVKRIMYYFVEALQERIERETGRIASEGLKDDKWRQLNVEEAMKSPNPTMLASLQEIPFIQPTQFAGIQAIVENVVDAKKVHVIDLGIWTGVKWTLLMQALVAQYKCPLELLKITAVATTISELRIQKTGKRLMDFAETINLPLSFKMVTVSDFKDLKKDVFEVEADEVLVVYSEFFLKMLLNEPDCLESVMRVIKSLQPCVMVVTEVEANHNSQDFMARFREALFYFSAIFDSIEACMDRFSPNRISIEGVYLSHIIRTIVAMEGEGRTIRHEKIDFWRAFFARFRMVETELSASSLYQAKLVVKKFPCWSFCTLTMNGKCLLTGWKRTPILSVSVWKFQ